MSEAIANLESGMIATVIIVGYLLGSIPVAWIVTRMATGGDLRRMGSGNVGVMNTAISVGRWAGLLVFAAEIAKGVLAVLLPRTIGGGEHHVALAVLATVIGTRWPIWLRGAGGRGNTATGSAVFLISWQTAIITLIVWWLLRRFRGSSYRATQMILFLLPLIFGLVMRSAWYGLFGAALSLLYLSTQSTDTDDHTILKEEWPSLWAFLRSSRRRGTDKRS